MAENRKYYYLKLKENYFDEDTIVLLESMPDGILYSNILLKLYLKALKWEGKLQIDEGMPYTAQMIATLTRNQIGTVERALKIFLQLGLMEEMPQGGYYMSNMELLVGQSSTEAERKKRARRKLKELPLLEKNGHLSTILPDIRPPEIEIEKELEIEKETEREKKAPSRKSYGEYSNVFLSEGEVQDLDRDYPDIWQRYAKELSSYMKSSGKTYESHSATIRRWIERDCRSGKAPEQRNYDEEEGSL